MTQIIRNAISIANLPLRFHHPLADLGIGDGYEVPLDKWDSARVQACDMGRKLKRKFGTRKANPETVLVYRIS